VFSDFYPNLGSQVLLAIISDFSRLEENLTT